MGLGKVLSFSCHTNCFWFHRTYVTLVVYALKYFQVVSVRISNRALLIVHLFLKWPPPIHATCHSCYLQIVVVAFVQKRIEASSTDFKPYHRQQTLFSPIWNRMVM